MRILGRNMAVLITLLIIFYLALFATVIYYLLKMNKLQDVDKKLHLTDKCAVLTIVEQIIALIAEHAYLAATTKGVTVSVPEWAAILSACLCGAGFVLTGYFSIFYSRKHFPEYHRKGKVEEKYFGLGRMTAVGLGMAFLNFWFNVIIAGGLAYFAA